MWEALPKAKAEPSRKRTASCASLRRALAPPLFLLRSILCLEEVCSMAVDYLQKILTAKVYDVAIESPLDHAPALSRRIGNRVLLKREDQQPVFSFKLRGAYNKMAHLSAAERAQRRRRRVGRQSRAGCGAGGAAAGMQGNDRHADHHADDQDSRGRVARGQGRAARRFLQRRVRARAASCRKPKARFSFIPMTIRTSSPGRARSRWKSCGSGKVRSTRFSSRSAAAG